MCRTPRASSDHAVTPTHPVAVACEDRNRYPRRTYSPAPLGPKSEGWCGRLARVEFAGIRCECYPHNVMFVGGTFSMRSRPGRTRCGPRNSAAQALLVREIGRASPKHGRVETLVEAARNLVDIWPKSGRTRHKLGPKLAETARNWVRYFTILAHYGSSRSNPANLWSDPAQLRSLPAHVWWNTSRRWPKPLQE